MDELEARIAELREREELAAIRPDLDGRDIMAHLGLRPGPVVGRALAYLLEARLEEGPHSPDAALGILDQWWAAQPEARQGP
jgi:poly(A) polymerase